MFAKSLLQFKMDFLSEIQCDLNTAIIRGCMVSVQEAISKGADISKSRSTPISSYLLLGMSVSFNQYDMVKFLLDNSFDVNSCDPHLKKTALHHVNENPDESITELLISRGAKIEAECKYGRTPLFKINVPSVLKTFIDNGANVNATDEDGNTPIFFVDNIEAAKLLISGGAIDVRNNKGIGPLHAYLIDIKIHPANAKLIASYLHENGFSIDSHYIDSHPYLWRFRKYTTINGSTVKAALLRIFHSLWKVKVFLEFSILCGK